MIGRPALYIPAHVGEDEEVAGVLQEVEREHDRQDDLVDDRVLLLDLRAETHAEVVEGHLGRVPKEEVLRHVRSGQAVDGWRGRGFIPFES